MNSRFLICSLLAASLIGCAFGKSNDDSKEQENREELLTKYSVVQGTYDGYLYRSKPGSQPTKAQLILYTMNETSGDRNELGQEQLVPVLKAFLKLNDLSAYVEGMSVRYIDQSGNFIANGKNSVLGAEGNSIEIDGSLIGNSLVADYKKENGKIGRIELYRTTASTNTFSDTAETDFFNDLRKSYCRLQGTYETVFTARDGVKIPLQFELNVVNTILDGKTIPKVEATIAINPSSGSFQKRVINVQIDTELEPIEVFMNSYSQGSSSGSANSVFSFSGIWTGSSLNGNLVAFGENQGFKEMKLNKKLPSSCK